MENFLQKGMAILRVGKLTHKFLFFASDNIMAAILLWRLITFYSCIVFGFYALKKNKKKLIDEY